MNLLFIELHGEIIQILWGLMHMLQRQQSLTIGMIWQNLCNPTIGIFVVNIQVLNIEGLFMERLFLASKPRNLLPKMQEEFNNILLFKIVKKVKNNQKRKRKIMKNKVHHNLKVND
jgi:hypothetical protein